jgi:hypothetical protein
MGICSPSQHENIIVLLLRTAVKGLWSTLEFFRVVDKHCVEEGSVSKNCEAKEAAGEDKKVSRLQIRQPIDVRPIPGHVFAMILCIGSRRQVPV